MAIKKSELYSSLWASCDELRGGMDASQYKDYVLTLLFVKYISDKYKNQRFGAISVPQGASFEDMVKLVGTPNIGDDVNKLILNPIKEANKLNDFPDFNDESKLGKGKDLVDTVSNLILIFNSPDLDFSGNSAEGDDILGDAYEYLMRHFATESGKSKGQFYTPAEVSRVLAKVLGINKENSTAQTTAYDPTCGSGSLLLKVADEAQKSISLYGQEKENTTANLAKMNMILHQNPTAEIIADNTLSRPFFKNDGGGLQTFDYVVANPPFSLKNWSNGVDTDSDEFGRFDGYGVPPEKNGDYAFLLHILKSLKSNGKAAVVLPHGVLFRGNAEAAIRKNIISKGYIKAIIGLPANLFYGTGIPACIIVLDKENAAQRKGIFMIDASKGFRKDGDKNRLREQDIRKITDVFRDFQEVEKFSRMVPVSEIADEKNDYNLNLPRYIDTQETEDIQDIYAHLNGGIPAVDLDNLDSYWKAFPGLKNELFNKTSEKYFALMGDKEDIRKTIYENAEFLKEKEQLLQVFEAWKNERMTHFKSLGTGFHPKDEIMKTSDLLLQQFMAEHLLNPYDLYENLMLYWQEVMQDDCYTLSSDGWKAGNQWERQVIKGKKSKDGKQAKDKTVDGLKGVTGKLLPPDLLIDEYFAAEKQELQNWDTLIEQTKSEIAETEEEQNTEDGVFADLDSVSATTVKKLLAEKKKMITPKEELNLLESYLKLHDLVKATEKKKKEAEAELEQKVLKKYAELSEAEIKELLTEKKWAKHLRQTLENDYERISQNLARRIKELAERYETTLPQLEQHSKMMEEKVKQHLEKLSELG